MTTTKKPRRKVCEPLEYRVRAARMDDLDAVAAMRAALWPDGSRKEHAEELCRIFAGEPVSTLPFTVLVAETTQGEIVGFADVGLRSHADGCDPMRPVGFLEGWFVSAKTRRMGVGRALIIAAEAWARGQGCREMASDTWIDNPKSVRAHEALGFTVVDRCVNLRKDLRDPPPPS